jgi:hypothetical protein
MKVGMVCLLSCALWCGTGLIPSSVATVEDDVADESDTKEQMSPKKRRVYAATSAALGGGSEGESASKACSSSERESLSALFQPPVVGAQDIAAEEHVIETRRNISVQTDDGLLEAHLVPDWFANCEQAFISAIDYDGSGKRVVHRLVVHSIAGDDPVCAVVSPGQQAFICNEAEKLVRDAYQRKQFICKMYDSSGVLKPQDVTPRPGQSTKEFLRLHDNFLVGHCFDSCVRLLTFSQKPEEVEVVSGFTIPVLPFKTDTLNGLCKAAIAKALCALPDDDDEEEAALP